MKTKPMYKQARTMVYKVLFGMQEHTYLAKGDRPAKRSNAPEHDETRRLSAFWEYAEAESVFNTFINECRFTKERVVFLRQRLADLKVVARRKQAQGAE